MNMEEIKIATGNDKIVDVHPSTFKESIYKYFALFEHMAEEHNLTLLESELQQIYNIVNKDLDNENQQLLQELRKTQAQYEGVVQQNKELQQDLKNSELETSSLLNLLNIACNSLAEIQRHTNCQRVSHRYECNTCDIFALNNHSNCAFNIAKEARKKCGDVHGTKRTLNPFADDYFRNLTYAEIAELAKKSIRLTTENCEMQHKIEDYIEGQCSNCEKTSEHCEFCDIQDLKKITGGGDDTAN